MSVLSDTSGAALPDDQPHEWLERQNRILSQILGIGDSMRLNLDLDDLLEHILIAVHDALGFAGVSLGLFDQDGQHIRVYHLSGQGERERPLLEDAVSAADRLMAAMRQDRLLYEGCFFISEEQSSAHLELDQPTSENVSAGPSDRDSWRPGDMLIVPIESGTPQVVGFIAVDEPANGLRPDRLTLRALRIFANKVAVGLENNRLYREAMQAVERRAILHRAAQEISASTDRDQVCLAVHHAAGQVMPIDAVVIALVTPDTQALEEIYLYDGGKRWPGDTYPIGPGLTSYIITTGRTLNVPDINDEAVAQETRALDFGEIDLDHPLAALAVPLRLKGRVTGMLSVQSYATAGYSAEDQDLLELLAAHAAIAFENVRLYAETQRYAADLQQRVASRTAELQAERNRLAAILDSAGEVIQIVDLAGQILYCNPAVERITGYTAAEMIGQKTTLWKPGPLNAPGKVAELRRSWQSGRMWQGELLDVRRDGTPYYAAVSMTPLNDAAEQLTGYVIMYRDITQLKELERLKDEFVSRIGHELRTPVSNLLIYITLLKQASPLKQADYLQTLQSEAERLRRLVEGFLAIAELAADAAPPQWRMTHVNDLVAELIAEWQPIAQARQLTLALHSDPALPRVKTDVELLTDALSRVLENALNYTPPGGTVIVITRSQHLEGRAWFTITVQDTGPGLSSSDLPHLFERFYRGSAARDYRIAGAGLGLAISKMKTEKMGGRVTVVSQPGQGAAFTLWLKLVDTITLASSD